MLVSFSENEEQHSPENIFVSSVSLGNQSQTQQSDHHTDSFSVKKERDHIVLNTTGLALDLKTSIPGYRIVFLLHM